jgi:hypothetical protein
MAAAASGKKQWRSDSVDGALLFILFQDRFYHPDSYSAVEIYDNPLLPFQVYSRKNFKTYCQTIANRAKCYTKFGTGVSNVFKDNVKEAREKYSDLLQTLKLDRDEGAEDEDEDDESYQPDGEEDLDFNPADFDEDDTKSLSSLVQNARLDARHDRQNHATNMPARSTNTQSRTAAATTSRRSTVPSATASNEPSSTATGTAKKISILDPYMVPYPSKDKIFGQVPMRGNVEEDDGFKLEIQPWKTQVWSKVPKELESAYDLLGDACRLSDNAENCPHTMILQAAINERLAAMDIKQDNNGDLWILEYELPHPFETLTDFYDNNGAKMDQFFIQANDFGYHYCQFWLKAVPKQKEKTKRATGKRVGKAKKSG